MNINWIDDIILEQDAHSEDVVNQKCRWRHPKREL